jgi:hypothetical protein
MKSSLKKYSKVVNGRRHSTKLSVSIGTVLFLETKKTLIMKSTFYCKILIDKSF